MCVRVLMRSPLRLRATAALLGTFSLVFAGSSPMVSQESQSLTVGSRIRVQSVTVGRTWLIGNLQAVQGDSLWLLTGEPPKSMTLAIPALARLELSRGRRRQAGRGAWIGAVAGGALGFFLGVATYEECDACFGPDPGVMGNGILGSLVGGVFGLGVGALVGGSIRAESWRPVPRPWSVEESP